MVRFFPRNVFLTDPRFRHAVFCLKKQMLSTSSSTTYLVVGRQKETIGVLWSYYCTVAIRNNRGNIKVFDRSDRVQSSILPLACSFLL
jgi:hypothetical protein